MNFEWNDAKHERNLRVRDIGFDDAATIFRGDTVEVGEDFDLYGEVRMQAIGTDRYGRTLFVVYTDCDDGARRIISARKVTPQERHRWLARR